MLEACVLVGTGPATQKFRELRDAARVRELHIVVICPAADLRRLRAVIQAEGTESVTTVLDYDSEDTLYERLLGGSLDAFHVRALIPLSENAAVPVSFAAETLGHRGSSVRAAILSRRKDLQRRVLREFRPPFAGTIPTGAIGAPPSAEFFPVIVKPAELSGSRGIRVITDPVLWQTLPDENHSRVVETFVAGDEFSVEGIVADGQPQFLGIARKSINQTFAEVGHRVGPDVVDSTGRERLIAAARRVIAAAGFRTGFLHAEFKLTEDIVQLIEFAVRPPGDALVLLHSLSIGRPLEQLLLDAYLDISVPAPDITQSAAQTYVAQQQGRLLDLVIDDADVPIARLAEGQPWPDWATWQQHDLIGLLHLSRGSSVGPVRTNFDRVASVVAHGRRVAAKSHVIGLESGIRLDVGPQS